MHKASAVLYTACSTSSGCAPTLTWLAGHPMPTYLCSWTQALGFMPAACVGRAVLAPSLQRPLALTPHAAPCLTWVVLTSTGLCYPPSPFSGKYHDHPSMLCRCFALPVFAIPYPRHTHCHPQPCSCIPTWHRMYLAPTPICQASRCCAEPQATPTHPGAADTHQVPPCLVKSREWVPSHIPLPALQVPASCACPCGNSWRWHWQGMLVQVHAVIDSGRLLHIKHPHQPAAQSNRLACCICRDRLCPVAGAGGGPSSIHSSGPTIPLLLWGLVGAGTGCCCCQLSLPRDGDGSKGASSRSGM